MIIACPACRAPVASGEPLPYDVLAAREPKNALEMTCTRCDCIFAVQVAILKSGRQVTRK